MTDSIDTDKYILYKDHSNKVDAMLKENKIKDDEYEKVIDKMHSVLAAITEENNKFFELNCTLQSQNKMYKSIGFPIVFLVGVTLGFFYP